MCCFRSQILKGAIRKCCEIIRRGPLSLGPRAAAHKKKKTSERWIAPLSHVFFFKCRRCGRPLTDYCHNFSGLFLFQSFVYEGPDFGVYDVVDIAVLFGVFLIEEACFGAERQDEPSLDGRRVVGICPGLDLFEVYGMRESPAECGVVEGGDLLVDDERRNRSREVVGLFAAPCADAVFCFSCGTRIKDLNADEMEAFPERSTDAAENAGPAFRPVDKDAVKPEPAAVKRPVQKRRINFAAPVEEKEEEVSVFAQGLPSWDVVPPQVVVRRMKKK